MKDFFEEVPYKILQNSILLKQINKALNMRILF